MNFCFLRIQHPRFKNTVKIFSDDDHFIPVHFHIFCFFFIIAVIIAGDHIFNISVFRFVTAPDVILHKVQQIPWCSDTEWRNGFNFAKDILSKTGTERFIIPERIYQLEAVKMQQIKLKKKHIITFFCAEITICIVV